MFKFGFEFGPAGISHFFGRFGIVGGGLRFDPGLLGIDGGALKDCVSLDVVLCWV